MSVLEAVPGPDVRAVALTFDDGPGRYTPQVLEVLARYHVRATFFVCGTSVARHRATLREVVSAGHLIGNHTYHHPQTVAGSSPYGHFDELDETVQARELDTASAAVDAALGRPLALRVMRGPGGRHHSEVTRALARARGMAVVGWSVDTEDWHQPTDLDAGTVDGIVRLVTSTTVTRPIVLMHDAKASAEPEHVLSGHRRNTVAALPRLIEHLGEAGYAFVAPDGLGWPV